MSILISIGCVFLAIGIAHFAWCLVELHRLRASLALLHSAGEPLCAAELKLNTIPDSQNASVDFRAASESIDQTRPAWKTVQDADSSEFQFPLNDVELTTVKTILSENAEALSRTESARGKTADGWNDDIDQLNFPESVKLTGVRDLCNLLKLSAMAAHSDRDDNLTVARLTDALSESDAAQHRPTLIGHVVAGGCTCLACRSISIMSADLNAGQNGLTIKQMRDLLQRLQDEQQMGFGNQLGWRSERIVNLKFLQSLESGEFGKSGAYDDVQQMKLMEFGYFIRPIILTDERLFALHIQDTLYASNATDWPTAQRLMPRALSRMIDAHPMYHMAIYMITPNFDKAIQSAYHAVAERRLAVLAVAVRIFAADHANALPTSLNDLVPKYLPAIPIDPLSAQPMKYESSPPRIYSIGDDGIDDHGTPQDPNASNVYYRRHGDIVTYLTLQPRKIISSH